MSSVWWPSARCARTRAMASGNARVQEQVAEQLPGVGADALDGGALVAAVEGAEEVAAVAAVDAEQPWALGQDSPAASWARSERREVAGREPGVGLDDVRVDERLLEVEDRAARLVG